MCEDFFGLANQVHGSVSRGTILAGIINILEVRIFSKKVPIFKQTNLVDISIPKQANSLYQLHDSPALLLSHAIQEGKVSCPTVEITSRNFLPSPLSLASFGLQAWASLASVAAAEVLNGPAARWRAGLWFTLLVRLPLKGSTITGSV